MDPLGCARRGRAVAAAIAVVVAAVGCRVGADAATDAERAAVKEAAADLARLDEAQAARLELWLASVNPHRRQAALLRYQALPSLLRPAAIAPLLALVDDDQPRFVGAHCTSLGLAGASRHMGEGEYEHLARCQRNQRSNADLALEVLGLLSPRWRRERCAPTLALMARAPRHGERLWPVARAACSYSDVLAAVAAAPTPAATQTLLYGFVDIRVGADARELAGVLPLLTASEARTRGLAAMAIVIGAERHGAAGLPADAAWRELHAAVDDDASADVIRDLPALAYHGAPLGPALVRRLGRPSAIAPLATLSALIAVSGSALPPGADRELARLLAGDLAEEALGAIAGLTSADARTLRPHVLKASRRADIDLSLVLRALETAERPLSSAEFRALDALFTRGCRQEPFGYHDDPDEPWCHDAEEAMVRLALDGGFRFRVP